VGREEITRRSFLTRLSVAGGLVVGSSALLSACGGGDKTPAAEEAPAAEEPAAEAAAEGCTDVSGLTESEVQMRNSLQYVDTSTTDGKTCANCALYIPAEEGAACGGCNLIKGPINPDGYCMSWAPKTS